MKRRISWLEIWHADASRLKFLVQSVYEIPPSPANLYTWEKSGIPPCPFSTGKSTLKYIMSVCPRALDDERYRWRHDWVLKTVADTVDAAIRASNFKPGRSRFTSSKPANAFLPQRVKLTLACLSTARNRQLRVNIWERLKVPEQIATTALQLVNRNMAGCADRIDSPVGGKYRGGPRKKA